MLIMIDSEGTGIEWHVGEPQPKIASPIICVQADGDELYHILKNLTNLPQAPSKKVVQWFGDHALFIVNNLPYGKQK